MLIISNFKNAIRSISRNKIQSFISIIGIVKDFNAHSLHTHIQPMVILQQNPDKMGLIAIKTSGNNDEAIIKRLRELYTQISPDEIFETTYLTEDIANFYGQESNQSRIIAAFSALAVILAMMGLFGISKWLERFAYRTELSWWIFGLAGVSAILIALLTVSWQSWRAATRNPVEALRYE